MTKLSHSATFAAIWRLPTGTGHHPVQLRGNRHAGRGDQPAGGDYGTPVSWEGRL